MSYVCIQSEPACWTVGFYDPDGEWQSESDHSTPDGALARVAYLNGGGDALELRGAIKQLKERVTMLEYGMIDLKTAAAFAPQIEHLRGQMTELETTIAENAAMRQAIAEAGAVIERLPVADDPYMPTPEEWAANPWATASTTDADGYLSLYEQPPAAGVDGWTGGGMSTGPIRYTTPPDWRVTLRTRPSHL